MKTTLLALLLAPALAIAADEAKPAKPDKGTARPNVEEAFKKLDTNTDGSVSLDEFKAGPRGKKDPAKAEQAYRKLDKDSDGKLTLDEFKAGRPAKGDRPGKPGKEKPAGDKPAAAKTGATKSA